MLSALCLCVFAACSTPRQAVDSFGGAELKISKGTAEFVYDGKALAQHLEPVTVTVADPVYGKQKKYFGYRFGDILNLAGIDLNPDDMVIFSALDGYQARASSLEFLQEQSGAVIAVKDLDFAPRWEPLRQGKEWISPGPFYLVWDRKGRDSSKLPWPYQITEIRVRRHEEERDKILPKALAENAAAKRGFEIFERNCLACHSINLEGGVLGPELNVPRNVTEYRDPTLLKEFISNPSSFRARSKMPAFEQSLSPADLEDVLAYLTAMTSYKAPQAR